MDMQEWYITQNEEWFNDGPYDTKEDAILEGTASYSGEPFFVGKRRDINVLWTGEDIVDTLYERLQDQVYEECGSDAADNWPERKSKEATKEAGEKIRAIIIELYGKPTVFAIADSEQIVPELEVPSE
jgi:hypothetical protein